MYNMFMAESILVTSQLHHMHHSPLRLSLVSRLTEICLEILFSYVHIFFKLCPFFPLSMTFFQMYDIYNI